MVSYELRTPLTSIWAALGLLMTGMLGTLPERGQRMLEIALSNTDRLMHLVEVLEGEPELANGLTTPPPVVAEGVETHQQLLQLKALRCEYAQGFFFSKPVDSEAASALIKQSLLPLG